jgi:hypothetical protein
MRYFGKMTWDQGEALNRIRNGLEWRLFVSISEGPRLAEVLQRQGRSEWLRYALDEASART